MAIKTILVDDDRFALDILAYDLEKYPDIRVEGVFTDPMEALAAIEKIRPEAVFLDINMPRLKGIDAAARIRNLHEETQIVFITSHHRYAVDAFEIDALDYLVKPVSRPRLDKAIGRLVAKMEYPGPHSLALPGNCLEINCLGRFEINWKGESPIQWRSPLTRELAAFLIQNRGKKMSKEYIIEALWPDDSIKTSVARLYSGVHYIRKALEAYRIERGMIELSGKYFIRLGPGLKPDAVLFEDAVARIDADTDIASFEAGAALYTGDYLEGESWLWAYPERARLNGLHLGFVLRLAQKYMDIGAYEKAEAVLLKAYDKNPYEEEITLLLLKMYKQTRKKSKAVQHFYAYKKILDEELSINPQKELMAFVAGIE